MKEIKIIAASFFKLLIIYFLISINIYGGFFVMFIFLINGCYKNLYFQLFNLFFQNLLIGLFAYVLDSSFEFNFMHSLNYVIPTLSLFIFLAKDFDKLLLLPRKIVVSGVVAISILIVFLLIGLAYYGVQNSMIYFRLFSIPFIFLLLGYYLKFQYNNDEKLITIFKYILLVLVVSSFIGKFSNGFLNMINYEYYMSYKYHTVMTVSEAVDINMTRFMNLSFFNLKLFRFGSLMHNIISYSYVVILLSTFLLYVKEIKKRWYAFIFISLIFITFSKGTIIFGLMAVSSFVIFMKWDFSVKKLLLLLLPIWIVVILLGISINNQHTFGLISGFDRLIDNPLGNGLGFSGNLSSTRLLSAFGGSLPKIGSYTRLQNGSESIFGVLFSSLGIWSFLYLFLLLKIIVDSSNGLRNKLFIIMPILLVFQGIFQEESFSPYALGLAMFILGYLFSNKEYASSMSENIKKQRDVNLNKTPTNKIIDINI